MDSIWWSQATYLAAAIRWTVPLPSPNCLAILCRPGRPGAASASRMRPCNLVSMNGRPQCFRELENLCGVPVGAEVSDFV